MLKILKKLLRLPFKKYDKRIAMLRQLRDGILAFQNFAAKQSVVAADNQPRTAAVIFSKDRPLQLELLLHSINEFVRPKIDVHIIYHCADADYSASYNKLAAAYSAKFHNFLFHAQTENGFKSDLLQLLANITEERLFFLVDDIVFTYPVDLNIFNSYDLYRFIPSLRLGKNLSFCYTLNQQQLLPQFIKLSEGLQQWRWEGSACDWNYPLSVDGHIFSRELILELSKIIEFSAPNTYEGRLQVFREIFLPLNGLCHEKSRMVNIPCNKVQAEENKNRSGDIDPAELHRIYQSGQIIDLKPFHGFNNNSVHQEVAFSLKTENPQG